MRVAANAIRQPPLYHTVNAEVNGVHAEWLTVVGVDQSPVS